MKRIEFIAPVESMRGNLGSKQALVYAPNNNRAFDSIEGQLNPALNYEPRLIGAKGKRNYFCVKTKSSNHLTTLAKTTMANLGGVGAVYGAIVRDKSQMVYINAQACYHDVQVEGYEGTFRKYMYGFIKTALDNKSATIDITTTNHEVHINNPWIIGGSAFVLDISQDIIIKFWNQFANNGVTYTIDGVVRGVGWSNLTFGSFSNSLYKKYNFLNLELYFPGRPPRFVRYGKLYLLNKDGQYVNEGAFPYNGNYTLTEVAP